MELRQKVVPQKWELSSSCPLPPEAGRRASFIALPVALTERAFFPRCTGWRLTRLGICTGLLPRAATSLVTVALPSSFHPAQEDNGPKRCCTLSPAPPTMVLEGTP